MFLHNNLKFDIGAQHTINGVQYPRGWFLDAISRAALGIIEVPDPIYPDPETHTYVENPDGSLTVTPRTAEDIAARTASALVGFQAYIVRETQQRLDAFAQTRGYDGILSACTYATDPVAKFANEGAYAVSARSQTWATLYALLDAVNAGTTPMPTSFADVEPLLPVLVWPV